MYANVCQIAYKHFLINAIKKICDFHVLKGYRSLLYMWVVENCVLTSIGSKHKSNHLCPPMMRSVWNNVQIALL
jgi:hypothetical protein